jgi:hypothetical protein
MLMYTTQYCAIGNAGPQVFITIMLLCQWKRRPKGLHKQCQWEHWPKGLPTCQWEHQPKSLLEHNALYSKPYICITPKVMIMLFDNVYFNTRGQLCN